MYRRGWLLLGAPPPWGGLGGGLLGGTQAPPCTLPSLIPRSGVKKSGEKKMTLVGIEPGRRVSKVSAPTSEPHQLLNTAGRLDASRIWFFGPPSHFGFCNKRPF